MAGAAVSAVFGSVITAAAPAAAASAEPVVDTGQENLVRGNVT
jgi:hypothetical protein